MEGVLAEVKRAIEALYYGRGDGKQANQWLSSLHKRDDAWTLGLLLVQQPETEAQFIGSQILVQSIRSSWHKMDVETKERSKETINQMLRHFVEAGPPLLLRRVSLLFAITLIKTDESQLKEALGRILDHAASLSSNLPLCGAYLQVLEMVPEEMMNGTVGIARVNRLRLHLRDGALALLDLSLSLLQTNSLPLILQTISCLSSWRSLVWSHNFPEYVDHGVWDVLMSRLASEELATAVSELLEEVVGSDSSRSPSRFFSFLSSLFQLPFSSLGKKGRRGVSRVAGSLLQHHSALIIEQSLRLQQPSPFLSLLEQFMELCGQLIRDEDSKVSGSQIGGWEMMCEEVKGSKVVVPLVEEKLFGSLIVDLTRQISLQPLITSHPHLIESPAFLDLKNTDGPECDDVFQLQDFRKQVSFFVQTLYRSALSRGIDLFQPLISHMLSHQLELNWVFLEAAMAVSCWVVADKAIKANEMSEGMLQTVHQTLLHSSLHPNLPHSLFRWSRKYFRLQAQSESVSAVFEALAQFVCASALTPQLDPIVVKTMTRMTENCGRFLRPLFDSFLQISSHFCLPSTPDSLRNDLLNALGPLLRHLDDQQRKILFERILEEICKRIQEAVEKEQRAATQDQGNLHGPLLRELHRAEREADRQRAEREVEMASAWIEWFWKGVGHLPLLLSSHSQYILHICSPLWSSVPALLSLHLNDEDTVQVVSRFVSKTQKVVEGAKSVELLNRMMRALLASFSTNFFSCQLDAISDLIETYGDDSLADDFDQMIRNLTASILEHTRDDIEGQMELVSAMLKMLSCAADKFFQRVLSLPLFPSIFSLAISLLSSQDRDATREAIRIIHRFIFQPAVFSSFFIPALSLLLLNAGNFQKMNLSQIFSDLIFDIMQKGTNRAEVEQGVNEAWRQLRVKFKVEQFLMDPSASGIEEEGEEVPESALAFLAEDENLGLFKRLLGSLSNRNLFRAMLSDFSQVLVGLQSPDCLLMYE